MGTPSRAVLSRLSPFLLVLLASASAWSLLLLAVPPSRQNYPLIDDWAFGRGALLFARGEGIHYSSWASMPQLGQWLWACPFVWLLGPSFFALRVSTIVLSWLGLWAFYNLLRQDEWPGGRAALATAALAFHPLFFVLQGTFMTDVPALSLSLIALTCYVRALREQRTIWWLAAVTAALLAAATRQTTLTVPIIAGFLMLRSASLHRYPLAWLCLCLPIIVGIGIHLWFQQRPDIIVVELRPLSPPSLLLLPFVVLHWCGLSILPFLALPSSFRSWRVFVIVLLLMAANAGYWLYHRRDMIELDALFPYTGTLLSNYGVDGAGIYVGDRPIVIPVAARILLTVLGCLGGAVFVVRAATWDLRRVLSCPVLLFSLSQLPFALIAPAVWDRYLLPLAVSGGLVLAGRALPGEIKPAPARWRWAASLTLLSLLAGASLALMHDWLAWNEALWELGGRAVSRHINPLDIDGGLEWNGWHCAPHQHAERRLWSEMYGPAIGRRAGADKGLTSPTTRVWFPKVSGRFALSFSPMENAVTIDSEPYRLWLLPGERRIYLLRHRGLEPQSKAK
jgi:hypothetical protein